MAFGTKTNERPGTKARAQYVRMSASKARAVLNLIRGKSVAEALDILALTERDAAINIAKILESAVANAEHNDEVPAEDLFVSACFADEGPTLKRFRPRARGRASAIHKQTCHITVIVSRYTPEEIDRRRAQEAAKGSARRTATSADSDRSARVAASKADTDDAADEGTEIIPPVDADGDVDAADSTDAGASDEGGLDIDPPAEVEVAAAPFGEGSHAVLEGDAQPDGFPIKGNEDSMKYHESDGQWYEQTVAEVWFATVEAAEAAGFERAGGGSAADGKDD